MVTLSDLQQIDVKISKIKTKQQSNKTQKTRIKPGEGVRLNELVGDIDVHKKVLAVAVASSDGIIAEHEFLNVHESINNLIQIFLYHKVKHVGIESTAEYWQKLAWKLSEAGFEVLVANPQQTKSTQGKKTDKLDAKRIAIALRDGWLKASVVCAPDQYVRRKLSRDAIKKSQQGANAINRMKMMFSMFDAEEWIEELHISKRGRRILLRCLELYDLDQFLAVLTDEYAHGRGRIFTHARLISKAKDLFVVLKRMDVDSGNRIRFIQHLDEYGFCCNMADSLYLEIVKHAALDSRFKRNLQFLMTLPGIDVRTALSILVEIADINCFEQSKSRVKWTELAPRVNQSGYKKRQSGNIYKGGNKWLRKTIWYAASLNYAHSKNAEEGHPVGAFIRRLMKSGKKLYKVAFTAGASKLTTYLFHILTQQIPFEEMFELQHSEWHKKNRERKLSSFKRILKRSATVDILPILVDELSQKTIELNHTETLIAKELSNLLGVGSVSSIDPPWS